MSQAISHVLILSLGPVQDFIASARRCQDLWYGSHLLSTLARASADAIATQFGAESLVFPGDLSSLDGSVANKLVVVVPEGQAPALVAEVGRDAMVAALHRERDRAFAGIKQSSRAAGSFHHAVANEQIDQLMEYVWVAVPVGPDGYGAAQKAAERALAARKNTRDWRALNGAAGVPKSSLDGARDSVIDESVYGTGPDLEEVRRAFEVRGAERLCGVGLLKRLGADGGNQAPVFHSTSHMASAPLRLALHRQQQTQKARSGLVKALEDVGIEIRRFRIGAGSQPTYSAVSPFDPAVSVTDAPRTLDGFDGRLLYESRVDELIAQYADPEKADDDRISALRDAVLAALRGANAGEDRAAYYALVLADGDRMGRAIDAVRSVDGHRRISAGLDREFAQKCRCIVENHGGSLIYAGGDDVLAMLPLHTALAAAEALRHCFTAAMQAIAEQVPEVAQLDGGLPTLSMGMAVAHHLEPFAEVRALAHSAERLAKQTRNSLAVMVAKRSGETRAVVDVWGSGDTALTARLETWARLLSDGSLPMSTPYHVEDALRLLGPPSDEEPSVDVVRALVRRAFARRDVTERIRTELDALANRYLGPSAGGPRAAVKRMSNEMLIAAQFAEAWRVAWGQGGR